MKKIILILALIFSCGLTAQTKIYEIQNKGKGVISELTPANLLLIKDDFAKIAISNIKGLGDALNLKENAFSKNTAFNKNFGTTSGTVAEGNDSRFTDSRNPLPNSANYIQNQNTAAQSANMWIGGAGQFGSSVTASQFFKSFSSRGTITSPFYEPLAIYGLGTSNLAGIYGGNSFSSDNGTFLKLRVNSNAIANAPIDALTLNSFGQAIFINTITALGGNSTNWNTAFGWGNHAVQSYLKAVDISGKVDKVTGKSLIADSEITRLATVTNQDLSGKENAFSKNTAFNKNFGTASGTVAEGNDSRILNGQTAFGWGNHVNGGYAITTGSNINQASFRTALGLGSNAYTSTAYLPLSGGTLTGIVTAPTAALGTNTTQIATTAFVQSNSRPYKVYTALLSQTGTSAPVATVLENTLGGTIVWSYVSIGQYMGTLTGAFLANKTVVFLTNVYGKYFLTGGRENDNSVMIGTQALNGGLTNGDLSNSSIEIRVYN